MYIGWPVLIFGYGVWGVYLYPFNASQVLKKYMCIIYLLDSSVLQNDYKKR